MSEKQIPMLPTKNWWSNTSSHKNFLVFQKRYYPGKIRHVPINNQHEFTSQRYQNDIFMY